MIKQKFVSAVADAVETLFDGEIADPHVEEIVEEYYGDIFAGDGAVADVQKSLRRVRKELEDRGHHVMLVNLTYYDTTKTNGVANGLGRICPDTPDEAWRCLPKGTASYGIRKLNGDLLSLTWLRWLLGSPGGRQRENLKRIEAAVDEKILPADDVRELLEGQKGMVPPGLTARIADILGGLDALPDESDSSDD